MSQIFLNRLVSPARAYGRFFYYSDCKTKPKVIRTDFDKKLLQGDVEEFIHSKDTDLEGAPPNRQHQNGLVERAWQSIVTMSRNWLTSSLLSSKYWYYAVKRAVEISNIMPTTHIKNKTTTIHELLYQEKVDYQCLFPMFSVAYIKQERKEGGATQK